MREILFKAKRKDNGKWVEGYYYKMSETTYCFKEDYERKPVSEHHYILQERMTDWGLPNQIVQIEIDSETLCQFTGLCDKNGKKIWENDIIKYHFREIYAPIKYGCYQNCFDSQKAEHIGFYVDWTDDKCLRKDLGYWIDMVYAMPVGNIFENKELLQEETNE
jgi:uncharacterized phage protein (TIGR01671 family)